MRQQHGTTAAQADAWAQYIHESPGTMQALLDALGATRPARRVVEAQLAGQTAALERIRLAGAELSRRSGEIGDAAPVTNFVDAILESLRITETLEPRHHAPSA